MSRAEERQILVSHSTDGCQPCVVETLLNFAEEYRGSMAEESNALRKRKLGTKTLVRVVRRIGVEKGEVDLYAIINRVLLVEFLPAAERMSLELLLGDVGIDKKTPPVRAAAYLIF